VAAALTVAKPPLQQPAKVPNLGGVTLLAARVGYGGESVGFGYRCRGVGLFGVDGGGLFVIDVYPR
jgi:hypothetical protein